jgi:hypothetical protein
MISLSNSRSWNLQCTLSVNWDGVGGLDGHVRALKEMVMLPLLYPELFAKMATAAPRGVLFYGPPGMMPQAQSCTLSLSLFSSFCPWTETLVSYLATYLHQVPERRWSLERWPTRVRRTGRKSPSSCAKVHTVSLIY